MKIMTAMTTADDQEQVLDVVGVIRLTQTLAKMLLSRKLLMELAGSLYTDYFVMEFTEGSVRVVGEVEAAFLEAKEQVQSGGSYTKIIDIPEPGESLKLGWSVVRLTQEGFWWVMDVQQADGDQFLRTRTDRLPWDLVLQAAGEFDPKEAVSDGSFLVRWKTEE